MALKSALSKPFAAWVVSRVNKWKKNAVKAQHKTLKSLVKKAGHTVFGQDHNFSSIKTTKILRQMCR
jgi:hypothetical protein